METEERLTERQIIDRIWKTAYLEFPDRHIALLVEYAESKCRERFKEQEQELNGLKNLLPIVQSEYRSASDELQIAIKRIKELEAQVKALIKAVEFTNIGYKFPNTLAYSKKALESSPTEQPLKED